MATSFDFTEVTQLAADLADVPRKTMDNLVKAIRVSAQNIKDDARNVAKGASGRHARAYPYAITYDIEVSATEVRAEIGPELGRNQGPLGFLEEGVGSQNTAAQGALRLAARANQDDFIRGVLLATQVLDS